jgi:hypothetical protein
MRGSLSLSLRNSAKSGVADEAEQFVKTKACQIEKLEV